MKQKYEAEYLTVKEFAEAVEKKEAGIYKSVQAGRLKEYSKKAKKNGKKTILIDKKAMALYHKETEIEDSKIEDELEKNSTLTQGRKQVEYTEADALKRELEEAKQIIKKKDEQIIELTTRLAGLAEKLAELTYNSQVLLKGEQEKKKGIFERIAKRISAPKNSN